MLVLTIQTRDGKNKVFIDDDIEITLLEIDRSGGQVKIGFIAPHHDIRRDLNMIKKKKEKTRSKTADNLGNK